MYKLGKIKIRKAALFDIVTAVAVTVGILALVALLFYNLIPLKLADIKVPVATDKSSYYPAQQVGGIFFGETYYDGNVRILREVFCANYHGVIKPPAEAADGDFFSTIAKPRKLDGTTVPIGNLPADVPVGQNCVIRFRNVYDIQTPFGVRHEEYEYYTQNFAITTKERRLQLDCEATGKSTDECQKELGTDQVQATENSTLGNDNLVGGGRLKQNESQTNNTSNTTTNNTTNNTTTPPPVTVHEQCTVDFIIKLNCRDVAD